MPDYTLRIVSEKEAESAEAAVRDLLRQIETGEINVEIFYDENYENKDVADEEIYVSDLNFTE